MAEKRKERTEMNMKKMIAGLVAVIMLMAMIPVVALAAGPVDASKVVKVGDNYYLVETMNTVSAVSSHSNTVYAPKKTGGDAQNNIDYISALSGDGVNYGALTKAQYSGVRANDAFWNLEGNVHVLLFGWVNPAASDEAGGGHNEPITMVGYQHNDEDIVWIDGNTASDSYNFGQSLKTTAVVNDPSLISALGGAQYARRYNIDIDFATLNWARNITHEIYFYAKDATGNVYCLNESLTGSSNKPVVISRDTTVGTHFDSLGNVYTLAADGYTLASGKWMGTAVSDNKSVVVDATTATQVYADGNGNYLTELPTTNFTFDQVVMMGNTLVGTTDTITKLIDNDVVPAPATANNAPLYSLDFAVGEYNGGTAWNNDFKNLVNGEDKCNVGTGNYWNNIGFYGWVSTNTALTDIGYSINGADTVWLNRNETGKSMPSLSGAWSGNSADPKPLWTGEAVLPGIHSDRYTIWVPVPALSTTCVNYIYLYVRDEAGTVWNMTAAATGSATKPIKVYTASKGSEIGDYTDGTNQYMLAADGTLKTLSGSTTGLSLATSMNGAPVAISSTGAATCTNMVGGFIGANVSLGADLSVTYTAKFYNKTDATVPTANFTMNGNTTTVTGVAGANDTYTFTFKNVSPQAIGDNIKAELYVGEELLNTKATYSVKENLLNLAANNASNAKLLTLIYNTLNYGAAAQTYVGYKTDALVNAGVADKGTSFENTTGAAQFTLTEKGDGAHFTSAYVYFSNVNQIGINYAGNATVKVNGVEVETEGNAYLTDGIAVSNFDTVYTFELYENGVLVQTMTYSINAYTARVSSALSTALYNYGAAAEAYLAA